MIKPIKNLVCMVFGHHWSKRRFYQEQHFRVKFVTFCARCGKVHERTEKRLQDDRVTASIPPIDRAAAVSPDQLPLPGPELQS